MGEQDVHWSMTRKDLANPPRTSEFLLLDRGHQGCVYS